MQEKLLQFIWRYSLYNPTQLTTTNGEPVTVVHPGMYNTNAGPDFLEAKIRVGDTLLVGHTELHINSSDWVKHKHDNDAAYNNVVLHVVYKHDADAGPKNTAVLELAQHIPADVLKKYETLMQSKTDVPCASQLQKVRDITKESLLSRMLAERWEEKQTVWLDLLEKSAGDWRNVLYWRMAANFGFKVNAETFLALAQSIPHNVFAKGASLLQTEAILFGQAGMLNYTFKDEYPNQLKEEYAFLKQKYKLNPLQAHQWKFLRLRPANFPTIRIAQFAALVHKSFHLFSQIVETHTVKEVLPLLEVTASPYWDNHYKFDEEADVISKKHLGKASVHNIIINTIAPIQFLYAQAHGTTKDQERALQLLDTIPAEKNAITTMWQDYQWKPANAGHSQAMIQLYNNYCTKKRCLECSVGLALLKN
jgi:hypothetical protein